VLLAVSLGGDTSSGRGTIAGVTAWIAGSLAVAAVGTVLLRSGAGLGTASGVLYAAGDIGTKAAVLGGGRLLFVPAVLGCHGLAFVCLQLAFQRGRILATAGLAVLWTNALPILAGILLFDEQSGGPVRVAAFGLVLAGAFALSRPRLDFD
jgi:hypothetical protein